MNGSFIEIDDPANTYVPSQSEIEEFARWLGAELPRDKSLLWIAKEALTAQIPPPWKYYQRKDGTGEPFYFNPLTGESIWDHPLDRQYKQLFLEEQKKLLAGLNPPSAMKNASNQNSNKPKAKTTDDFDIPKAQLTLPKPAEKPNPPQPQPPTEKENIDVQESKSRLKEIFHDDLEEMISNHEEEMQQMKEDFERRTQIMKNKLQTEFETRMKQEKTKYDTEIEKIQKANQEELTLLQQQQMIGKKETFKAQMDALEKSNDFELEKKKLELQAKITQLESENMTQIAQIKIVHQQEITEVLTSHQAQLAKLKSKLTREIDVMRRKARAKMDAIKESKEIEFLQEELEMKKKELQNKHEAEIKRMTKNHENQKKLLQEKFNGEMDDLQAYQRMSPFKEDNIMKQIKSELDDDKSLRITLDAKKAKILKQFKNEIDELKENHEEELKQLQVQHSRLVQSLKSEMEDLKRENEKEKFEMKDKCKNDVQKVREECDLQIMQLREELLTRKQQEKAQFAHDMQLMLTQLENEKMRTEQQKRAEIDEIRKRSISFQPERIFIREERKIPFLSITYQPDIKISPKASRVKQTFAPKNETRCSFSSQKVFSLRPKENPSSFESPKDSSKDTSKEIRKSQYIEQREPEPQTFSVYRGDKLAKQKKTLSKYDDQFSNICNSFDSSINQLKNEADSISSSYQELIASQTRAMSAASAEFNRSTQILQMTLRNTLSSIDSQFSMLSSKTPIRYIAPAPPQVPIEESESFSRSSFIFQGRGRQNENVDENYSEVSDLSMVVGHDSAKLLRKWRQQRKKRDVKRIK